MVGFVERLASRPAVLQSREANKCGIHYLEIDDMTLEVRESCAGPLALGLAHGTVHFVHVEFVFDVRVLPSICKLLTLTVCALADHR